MRTETVKKCARELEASIKRHTLSADETVGLALGLASAVIAKIAADSGDEVEDIYVAYILSLAKVLGLDVDDLDGETQH